MMQCPSCAEPMRATTVQPVGADRSVTIDHCDGCGGLWLDKGEADVVCPTFAYLDRRHIEITALGAAGAGIAKCPRCGATPHEFPILEVLIDYCGGCGGVWLDAQDHEGRTRDDHQDLLERGPYRAIQRAASTKEAACTGCTTVANVAQMYMATSGLVCRQCHGTALAGAADQTANKLRAHPIVNWLIQGLRSLAQVEAARRVSGDIEFH